MFGGKAYTLPEAKGVKGYNDIAPRMGMAYDVFGTGKTAIKVNLAKYWQTASNDGQYQTANPAATFVQTTTRSWVDGNRNFTPDCNLNNRAAQDNRAAGGDLCGAWDVANFGSIATATVLNPAVLEGWGIRPYDWQFSASVQQQIMPRVSAEIGYSRRWWGNFFFTDNRAVGPQDFDTMTFTAPTNAEPPEQRAARVVPAAQGLRVRQAGQLLHVRQRLRRRRLPLAGRRPDRRRAAAQRPDAAGRVHHRRRLPRLSARSPPSCRNC